LLYSFATHKWIYISHSVSFHFLCFPLNSEFQAFSGIVTQKQEDPEEGGRGENGDQRVAEERFSEMKG
jgi:hypothetical protein